MRPGDGGRQPDPRRRRVAGVGGQRRIEAEPAQRQARDQRLGTASPAEPADRDLDAAADGGVAELDRGFRIAGNRRFVQLDHQHRDRPRLLERQLQRLRRLDRRQPVHGEDQDRRLGPIRPGSATRVESRDEGGAVRHLDAARHRGRRHPGVERPFLAQEDRVAGTCDRVAARRRAHRHPTHQPRAGKRDQVGRMTGPVAERHGERRGSAQRHLRRDPVERSAQVADDAVDRHLDRGVVAAHRFDDHRQRLTIKMGHGISRSHGLLQLACDRPQQRSVDGRIGQRVQRDQ